jgi:hypothetical protein
MDLVAPANPDERAPHRSFANTISSKPCPLQVLRRCSGGLGLVEQGGDPQA